MAKKIRINSYTGPSDGADLEGYYFEESGDGYNFYAPTTPTPTKLNPTLIDPNVPSSLTFSFTNPGPTPQPTFTITVSTFPNMTMTGTWSDNTGQQLLKDVPGSGTFQAQASGTGPIEEEAAAASAK
jgi:hypothetical protein